MIERTGTEAAGPLSGVLWSVTVTVEPSLKPEAEAWMCKIFTEARQAEVNKPIPEAWSLKQNIFVLIGRIRIFTTDQNKENLNQIFSRYTKGK